MPFRTHILRLVHAAPYRWSVVIVLICLGGCQNNTQRDLIARDRRAQEDELYAMGDYISQYQQLVCQYRSENASLRRQLAAARTGTTTVRESQIAPERAPSTPATRATPRTAPSTTAPQSRTPQLEAPDVPPLNQGTSVNPIAEPGMIAQQNTSDPGVVLASYNETLGQSAVPPNAKSIEVPNSAIDSGSKGSARLSDVLLSGEVTPTSGAAPRFVVDIETLDASGRAAQFDGEASLVLVTSDGNGGQRNAAKWDFSAEDVRASIVQDGGEAKVRLRVELPAETPIGDASELWVRLVPIEGRKMLGHVAIDPLRTGKTPPSRPAVVQTDYVDDSRSGTATEAAAPINEGTWATAEPGKPMLLQQVSDEAHSGWRASSEVIPVASSSKSFQSPPPTVVAASHSLDAGTSSGKSPSKAAAAEVVQRPSWSPERPGASIRVARPTWSATR